MGYSGKPIYAVIMDQERRLLYETIDKDRSSRSKVEEKKLM
jgi:hypothetical protein